MSIDASVLTREYLNKRLDEIDTEIRKKACVDGSCTIIKPRGMQTNGGCRCLGKGHPTIDDMRNIKMLFSLYRQKVECLEELCKLK